MNIRYPSVDKTQISEKYPSNLNRFNMGGKSIILNNDFNILRYLNELEKHNTSKEIKRKSRIKLLPLLNSHNVQKKKNLNMSLNFNNINNISTIKNESCYKKNGCFLTSIGNENNKYKTLNENKMQKISMRYNNENKSKHRSLYRNNNTINYDGFSLTSIIREIKKKYNTRNISNSYRENKNNEMNDYIAYDEKNMDVIKDINNIINIHHKSEDWDIRQKENSTKDYIVKNKEIGKQNVLINLINNQKENVYEDHNKKEKEHKYIKNMIEEDEKEFENIKREQKVKNRLIDENLNKLIESHKQLLYLRENIYEILHKTEYDVLKLLYEIDEYRVYAKFIHYIYGYDTSKYEKEIIEKDNYKAEIDTEKIVQNILRDYKECLEDDYDIYSKFDVDIIYNEMRLIEDRILNELYLKNRENEGLNKLKENNREAIDYMKNRIIQLKQELKFSKEERKDFIDYISQDNDQQEIFLIAEDLFSFIYKILLNDNSYKVSKDKSDINPFEISDAAVKCYKLILKKELVINNYMELMEKYEKEDPKTFNEIKDARKKYIILDKIRKAKERIEQEEMKDKIDIQKKTEKIYFLTRSYQPTLPKKKKKIIKIDPEVERRQEELELLTYQ